MSMVQLRSLSARVGSSLKNSASCARVNGVFFATFTSERSKYQIFSVALPLVKKSTFVFTPAPVAVKTPPGRLSDAPEIAGVEQATLGFHERRLRWLRNKIPSGSTMPQRPPGLRVPSRLAGTALAWRVT
jgi:hypothetical protein